MRPLDGLRSIKAKLGVVIVATVAGTVLVLALGGRAGLSLEWRVALAVVLGLGMVQLLARGMTSPLREMAAAATAMARGDHARRVPATSRDEVGDLARAFNAMVEELEEVERQRRDLVANVSHELRTPLGALQAVLENLVDGVAPPDPAALRVALEQTERLGRLVAQLLDLSRWEAGALELHPAAFPVGDLLERAVRERALGEPAVPVEIAVEPAGLAMTGDAERLHQVVGNLLDNAIRHSPPGGRVWLTARRGAAGGTVIAVADEGPGIPDEEAERVFERFHRTESAGGTGPTGANGVAGPPATSGGTGLGLAIARWIVDAHRGQIRAERREPCGCRIVVEVPA